MTGLKIRGHQWWVYLFPVIHFIACCASMIGLVTPSLQQWGIAFTYILIADLPISIVAYMAAWSHGTFAFVWIFTVGTIWWFLIACVIEALVARARGIPTSVRN